MSSAIRLKLSTVIVAVLATSSLDAAVRTWSGVTDNDFNKAGNWDTLPGAGDTATFAGATPKNPSVTAAITVLGVNFTGAGYSLGGSGLVVGSGGIDSSGVGTNTIAGSFSSSTASTYTIGANSELVLSGSISTSGTALNLTKDGTGTWRIASGGSFSGTHRPQINAGTLTIDQGGSLASGNFRTNGGTVNVNGSIATNNNITANGGTINFGSTASIQSTATYRLYGTGGTMNFGADFSITTIYLGRTDSSNADATGYGVIDIGGNTLSTGGFLHNKSLTGTTVVRNGTLKLTAGAPKIALENGTAAVDLLIAATLNPNGKVLNFDADGFSGGVASITSANTYSTGTTVTAGVKLLADNTTGQAFGSGTVSVDGSSALGGTGTVAAVSIAAGGAIAPGTVDISTGASLVESLGVGGNLTLAGTYQWQLASLADNSTGTAGVSFDVINMTSGSAISLTGGSISLDFGNLSGPASGNPFWNSGHRWTVINNTSSALLSSTLTVINGADGLGSFVTEVASDGKSLDLVYTVPEPVSLGATTLAAMLLMRRRRTV